MYGLVNTNKKLVKGSVCKINVGTFKIAHYNYGDPILIRSLININKFKDITYYTQQMALGKFVGDVSRKGKKYIFIEILTHTLTFIKNPKDNIRTHPISKIKKSYYKYYSYNFFN